MNSRKINAHTPYIASPRRAGLHTEGTDSADLILAFPSSRLKTAGRPAFWDFARRRDSERRNKKRGGEGMNVLEKNDRRPMRDLRFPLLQGEGEGEVKYARGSSDSSSRLFDSIEQTSLGKAGSLTRSGERSEASGL